MDRGQAHTARDHLEQLYDVWSRHLGPEHEGTLWTAHYLARAYDDTRDHDRARALDEDTLRRRRTLGDDHPHTLATASNLSVRLGALRQFERARALAEDTLDRKRRTLCEDHRDTLVTNRLLDWLREADRPEQ